MSNTWVNIKWLKMLQNVHDVKLVLEVRGKSTLKAWRKTVKNSQKSNNIYIYTLRNQNAWKAGVRIESFVWTKFVTVKINNTKKNNYYTTPYLTKINQNGTDTAINSILSKSWFCFPIF